MTHELWIVEGYTTDFPDFEKDFNDRMYANGKARLRLREVRLYTCAINEIGAEEFRSDMKSLMGRIWGDRDDESFKWNKMISWFKPIMKLFGLKEYDWSQVKDSGVRGSRAEGKLGYKLHFIPLGYVPDARNKNDGSELV